MTFPPSVESAEAGVLMPSDYRAAGEKYKGKSGEPSRVFRRAQPREGRGDLLATRLTPPLTGLGSPVYASGLASAHGLRCWFEPPVGPKKPSIILLVWSGISPKEPPPPKEPPFPKKLPGDMLPIPSGGTPLTVETNTDFPFPTIPPVVNDFTGMSGWLAVQRWSMAARFAPTCMP